MSTHFFRILGHPGPHALCFVKGFYADLTKEGPAIVKNGTKKMFEHFWIRSRLLSHFAKELLSLVKKTQLSILNFKIGK